MKQYQVTILMNDETVTALERSGHALQAFRAIRSSDRAGRPLLWRRESCSPRTQVGWSDSYDAYTARDLIEPGKEIHVGFYAAVEAGDVLRVRAGGTGDVTADGDPRAISVQNTTTTHFTFGIGDGTNGGMAAFCAFPLHGMYQQVLRPSEKILLRFSTQEITPGTVIGGEHDQIVRTSFGPGILVDLAAGLHRELSYDIDEGWSWGRYSWARQIPAGADLVPLLIESCAAAAPVHANSHQATSGRMKT
jgi:hypothetical protein